MPEFKGPFGLWSFPLLNLFLEAFRTRIQASSSVKEVPFKNQEYYKIIRTKDGSIDGIEIHRKVDSDGAEKQ